MHKKAWFFKNKTVLGMLGVMLAFGTIAIGCPTDSTDSPSPLAPYAGVWRNENGSKAFLLLDNGTAWSVESSAEFEKSTWSTSELMGEDVTFHSDKTTFTLADHDVSTTYTKNTDTNMPDGAAAPTQYQGVWTDGEDFLDLKSDTAEFTHHSVAKITMNYRMDGTYSNIYLGQGDLLIVSIALSDWTSRFSKKASDDNLAGIWQLTKDGQDFFWNVDKDGQGTFHTLGASLPVSLIVSGDSDTGYKLNGEDYVISSGTLTIDYHGDDIALTKVDRVPSHTGAGGDASLHGTWKATQGSYSITITVNANGTVTMEARQGNEVDKDTFIWKANSGTLYRFSPDFTHPVSSDSYTVSGSTLTYDDGSYTKQ